MNSLAADPRVTFDPRRNSLSSIFALPGRLNPYLDRGVDIYAAPLYAAAMPNVKAYVVRHMFETAQKEGLFDNVHTIVEATSGNTGLSMGELAPFYRKKFVAVVERDLAPGKLLQLRMAGVNMVSPEGEMDTIEMARMLGEQSGWCNINQYGSALNVDAHRLYTGPHLWEQTEHKITVFSNGMGTAGTALGVKTFFEEEGVDVHVLGVACAEGSPVPGLRSRTRLKNVTLDWQSLHVLEATNREAYGLSLKLMRAGVMAGPSSGLALAGLLRFLEEREADEFDGLRNEDGRVVAVFGCGDTPMPYLEKYPTILDGDDFNPEKF